MQYTATCKSIKDSDTESQQHTNKTSTPKSAQHMVVRKSSKDPALQQHRNQSADSITIQCIAEVHASLTPSKNKSSTDTRSEEKPDSSSSTGKGHTKHSPPSTRSKYFTSAHNGDIDSSDDDHSDISRQQVRNLCLVQGSDSTWKRWVQNVS